jgi:hypothetical protein
MTPQVRAFRAVAAQVSHHRGERFATFLDDFGLEGILEEAIAELWTAQVIAVEVLVRCCVSDGRFNNFHVGLLSVMTYLNEQFGEKGEQAFRDLVSILNGGGEVAAIQGWMDTHYPEP